MSSTHFLLETFNVIVCRAVPMISLAFSVCPSPGAGRRSPCYKPKGGTRPEGDLKRKTQVAKRLRMVRMKIGGSTNPKTVERSSGHLSDHLIEVIPETAHHVMMDEHYGRSSS
ncbi:hypothetical protein PoB_002017800 [Plakobranchus ocellatus]|uniref:Uncharacterized protein n=1 Tax=Plakobranchus ocellatus TaxID=259542 RepID=A0AAV3ZGF2_9GAST|nr:hypothetical protein PoB_002017800 [Plakobranchus ocellatus]